MTGTRIVAVLMCLLVQQVGGLSAEEPVRLKVMTFNIYHGETMKGDFDLDRIARVISDADPDMVAMQEMDFLTKRARGYDLATELGWRTKMTSLFGRAMKYDGGEYGQAILSKHSFVSTRNVPLPHSEGREPRTALEARIQLPSGATIALVCTHLDHLRDETDRLMQARAIVEEFAGNAVPTILAGDLNALPESDTLALLREHWTPAHGDPPKPTHPSKNPRSKIDYIMFAPEERWRVIDLQVIADEVASDHCAVVAELELHVSMPSGDQAE